MSPQGELLEIVEGNFLDEARPNLRDAIQQRDAKAEQAWSRANQALQQRPQLPAQKEHIPRTEVQLGGFGGQGIMSAGKIIGRAAALYDKLEACFTQSYGPEARGGAAGSQVVFASDPIHHPHLIEPASMIIMSQGAYNKYVSTLAPGGTLLIDEELVALPDDHRTDINTYGIPATKMAEDAGNNRAANTAMLGLWTAMLGVLSRDAMRQAVAESVPPKTVDLNLSVFDDGYQRGLTLLEEEKARG